MKHLLCLLLMIPTLAAAATINLPVPSQQFTGETCPVGTTPAVDQTVVTGFTTDNNYVTANTRGYYTCGRAGRGGITHYWWWCGKLEWDLSGNVVNTTVTVSTTNYSVYTSCPYTNPNNVYEGAPGYAAETIMGTKPDGTTSYTPALMTP